MSDYAHECDPLLLNALRDDIVLVQVDLVSDRHWHTCYIDGLLPLQVLVEVRTEVFRHFPAEQVSKVEELILSLWTKQILASFKDLLIACKLYRRLADWSNRILNFLKIFVHHLVMLAQLKAADCEWVILLLPDHGKLSGREDYLPLLIDGDLYSIHYVVLAQDKV